MKTLLLVRLGGAQYGIWEEDVRSIEAARTIHHLPLSPDCIAGMAIIADSTVTLAELAACIGLPRPTQNAAKHILLGPAGDRTIGFVVQGDIDRVSIPAGGVFPMPEYLKTREMDTCVVHGSAPIPVINASHLFERIRKAEYERPVAACAIPPVRRPSFASIQRVRLFESGGELFCASANALRDGGVRPDGLSRLAYLPRYIEGMSLYRGTILPVIHLARKMRLPDEGSGSRMLVASFSRLRFGCLVDAGGETLPRDEFSIAPLPPLVASGWMRAAVVHAGEIFPLVEMAALLSPRHGVTEKKSPRKRNASHPQFLSAFGKEEVEVVEFSLLGARHALPGSEVEATLAVLPVRKLPNLPPIVVGVAEHGGELLPVLDLAMCFGKRSRATPEWRMILARSGDFRALIITEAVFGQRHLPVDMQRGLPIALPHGIVYGCYPDESRVKLILDFESLAVHSDKILVREAITTALQEMQQDPTEVLPSLFEPMAALDPAEPAGAGALAEHLEAAEGAAAGVSAEPGEVARSIAPVAREERHRTEETGEGSAGGMTAGGEESGGLAAQPPEPGMAFPPESEPPPRVQSEPGPEPGAELPSEAQPAEPEQPAAAAVTPEPETGRPAAWQETRLAEPGEVLEVVESVAEDEAREPTGVAGPREAGAGPALPGRDTEPGEAPRQAQAPDRVEGIGPAAGDPGEEEGEGVGPPEMLWLQDARETVVAEPHVGAIPENVLRPESTDRIAAPAEIGRVSAKAPPASKRRAWLLITGVAIALIAVLYAVNGFMKGGIDDAGKGEQAGTAVKADSARGPEPVARASAPGTSPNPALLRAPRDGGLGPGMYKVKRGDSLWRIAKRLTGNPLNYHRLASENDIANPDVIFPGQKLLVKREE